MWRFKGHWRSGRRRNCKSRETERTTDLGFNCRFFFFFWVQSPQKRKQQKKKGKALGHLSFNVVSDEPWCQGYVYLPLEVSGFLTCCWILVTNVSRAFVLVICQQHLKVCLRKWEKDHRAGQSKTPISLQGPSGHILRSLEGKYSCACSTCISYVFHWLEMVD